MFEQVSGILKRLNNSGYIQIKVGTQWKEEHRLVVEELVGRLLEDTEVVHHINFNREDNRPENLALFESQQAHAHWHRQFRQFGLTNPLRRELQIRKVMSLINEAQSLNTKCVCINHGRR